MTATIQILCVYVCDACGNSVTNKGLTEAETRLTIPWRYVQIQGWAGTFHACSEACEKSLRQRHAP